MPDAEAVRAVLREREAAVKARTPEGAPPLRLPTKKPPKAADPQELRDLDTAFRRKLFGLFEKDTCLARLEALLTSPDDKTALQAWDSALKHGLVQRKEGENSGSGAVTLNLNLPRPPAVKDVTP